MSRKAILLILLLSILLAACEVTQEPEPTSEPTEERPDSPPPTLPSLLPAPTRDEAYPGPGELDGYPGPDEPAGIPTTTLPEGYPGEPTPFPTVDPYPGGVAVIVIPAGLQCEEPVFTSLEEALATLEGSGIIVLSSEEEEMAVCAACGCPTSLHYKATIPPEDLNAALAIGWQLQ
jgi:hypothetical protein